jgi:hypothetical protein
MARTDIKESDIQDVLGMFNVSPVHDEKETFKCPVCFDDVSVSDRIVLECSHSACRECMIQMIVTCLQEKTTPLCSLDTKCHSEISEWILDELLTPQQLEEHHKNLLEKTMPANQCFWCPGKCGSIISFEDPSRVTRFECPDCKKEFCFKCECEWHKGSTCELYKKWAEENKQSSSLFFKYLSSHNVKKCPNCGVNIEKNMGCDHMTCSKCRYQWYWSTGEPYQIGRLSGRHPPLSPRIRVPTPRIPRVPHAPHVPQMPNLMDGTPATKSAILVRLNHLYGLLSKEDKADWLASILEEANEPGNASVLMRPQDVGFSRYRRTQTDDEREGDGGRSDDEFKGI